MKPKYVMAMVNGAMLGTIHNPFSDWHFWALLVTGALYGIAEYVDGVRQGELSR